MLGILIGVVITIIGMVYLASYISRAFSGTKTSQTMGEFTTIVANVQGLYASQPNFSGLTETAAIDANVFPGTMAVNGATTATDVYGGDVVVSAAGNPDEFTVSFSNIPNSTCIKLGSGYQSSNLVSLSVGSASLTLSDINPAALAGACTGGTNTMTWTLN
jgi:hypothetical protein